MAKKEPVDRVKFNDTSDPTYEFRDQCAALRAVCPECGTRFPSGSRECPECGAKRPRCKQHAMKNEIFCRSHMRNRPFTLYNKLAATIADTELEEIIEADDRDLSQEFALARVCLSAAMDDPDSYTSKDILDMVKQFFIIAEKKKNIEQGQVLNITFNDDMVTAFRARFRKILRVFKELVDEYVEDENIRKKMLDDLYTKTKLTGNMLSSPPKASEYVQPEGAREEIQAKLDSVNKEINDEMIGMAKEYENPLLRKRGM